MGTVPEAVHESTIGIGRQRWSRLVTYLEHVSPWLVVLAYVVVCAVLLAAAAVVALYLGTVLPGVLGGILFLTLGLMVIGAAPTAAGALFRHLHDAHDDQI